MRKQIVCEALNLAEQTNSPVTDSAVRGSHYECGFRLQTPWGRFYMAELRRSRLDSHGRQHQTLPITAWSALLKSHHDSSCRRSCTEVQYRLNELTPPVWTDESKCSRQSSINTVRNYAAHHDDDFEHTVSVSLQLATDTSSIVGSFRRTHFQTRDV